MSQPIKAKKSFIEYQDTPKPSVARKVNKNDSWVSPFHGRDARSMRRDYYRDDYGRPNREWGRHLVVEKPSISP